MRPQIIFSDYAEELRLYPAGNAKQTASAGATKLKRKHETV
jgi:hypothetical protein